MAPQRPGENVDPITLAQKIETDALSHPDALQADANLLNGTNVDTWNAVKSQIDAYNKDAASQHLPNITLSHDGPVGDGQGKTTLDVKPASTAGQSAWTTLAEGQIATAGGAATGAVWGSVLGPEGSAIGAGIGALFGETAAVTGALTQLHDNSQHPKDTIVTSK